MPKPWFRHPLLFPSDNPSAKLPKEAPHAHRTGHFKTVFRLRQLPPRAGQAGAVHPVRPGHARHHADRRREIHLLPGARAAAARADARYLAADLADEGSGRRAERSRRAGRMRQFGHVRRVHAGRAGLRGAGRLQAALRRPRAADRARLPVLCAARTRFDGDGRRGALHFPMGTGFPTELPENTGFSRSVARAAAGFGFHRYRNRGRARRHRARARPARPVRADHRL